MDRKLQQTPEIERLIRTSESARASLESEAELLRKRLDVPARIRTSLKSHPTGWLVGSLVSGLAASLLFGRKPQAQAQAVAEKKRRSLPLTLLGLSLTAVRPFAKVWLTDQVKHYFAAQREVPLENQPR